MNPAHKYPPPQPGANAQVAPASPALAQLPQAPGSHVRLIGEQSAPGEVMLGGDDLMSFRPQPPPLPGQAPVAAVPNPVAPQQVPAPSPPVLAVPPEPPVALPQAQQVPAPPAVPSFEGLVTTPEIDGDEAMAALSSQARRNKLRAVAMCLAFPAVIGFVLYSLSGDGHAKEPATPLLASAIGMGSEVVIKMQRDAAELAAIKKELEAPVKPDEAKAAEGSNKSKKRGLPTPR